MGRAVLIIAKNEVRTQGGISMQRDRFLRDLCSSPDLRSQMASRKLYNVGAQEDVRVA